MIHTAQNFRMHWAGQEEVVKRWITVTYLKRLLGDHLHTATIKLDPHRQRDMKDLLTEVVTQKAELVPIVQRGKPLRVMDRVKLATSIATSELNLAL